MPKVEFTHALVTINRIDGTIYDGLEVWFRPHLLNLGPKAARKIKFSDEDKVNDFFFEHGGWEHYSSLPTRTRPNPENTDELVLVEYRMYFKRRIGSSGS